MSARLDREQRRLQTVGRIVRNIATTKLPGEETFVGDWDNSVRVSRRDGRISRVQARTREKEEGIYTTFTTSVYYDENGRTTDVMVNKERQKEGEHGWLLTIDESHPVLASNHSGISSEQARLATSVAQTASSRARRTS